MYINKYKKIGKNKYKVYLERQELSLYEDIILKYDLLLKKDITLEELDKIVKDNREYEAYDNALNYIETRMRSKKELKTYLKRKEYDDKLIKKILTKIEELGLLDETSYIKAYINDKITLSNDGPYKIKRNLLEQDFKEEDIDNYLYSIDEEIWKEKINKLIDKKKSIMQNKSYYMFINKIKEYLFNLGYDNEQIDDYLSKIEYSSNALENDYNKALKKYKNDTNKIINYLLRKGYNYEEIKTLTK